MCRRAGQRGFTIIELVIVITILGVLAGILTPFIQQATVAYAQARIRNTLLTIGDLALERMSRDLREAIPNSISLINGDQGIEFLHARAGGRYVSRFDDFGDAFANPVLRLARQASIGGVYTLGTDLTLNAGDVLVIGNTTPADITTGTVGSSVRLLTITPTINAAWPLGDGTDQGRILTFAANHRFPIDSPGKHFLIADKTIEIGASGTTLLWHSAPGLTDFNGAADWSSADPILLAEVRSVHFSFQPGTPKATGVVRVDLELGDSGGNETLRLYREIHVRNTP
ncbi:MAG: prepilin-type N-terminal cleavage/methylation domain-containing protein [Gammaproteobacteria bacterium]|nr:prepilin-type N-terminal cleavage/methylation domain-containing protein [Gammaproteobacteria bacterium]